MHAHLAGEDALKIEHLVEHLREVIIVVEPLGRLSERAVRESTPEYTQRDLGREGAKVRQGEQEEGREGAKERMSE